MSKDHQRNTNTISRFRNVDSRFSNAHAAESSTECGDDDGDEILLSGSDYWHFDESITNEKQQAFNFSRPLLTQQHHRPSNSYTDPMGDTLNETGDWNSMRREGDELDEFAMLEKQLEDLSAPTQASRPLSRSQSSAQESSTFASSSQVSHSSLRASRPNLSRANILGNSIRLNEKNNLSDRPQNADNKGHDDGYHGHDSYHRRLDNTQKKNVDDNEDEEEREQSFLGSTSSTNYPNSSRRLDNPFLTSDGRIDRRRAMVEGVSMTEGSQRVDESQSWGATTRPQFDTDISSTDVHQEYDADDIGYNGALSSTNRNSRNSINSAFPVGERKREMDWERDQSTGRDNILNSTQRPELHITHSRPVLPSRDGIRDSARGHSMKNGNNADSNSKGGNSIISGSRKADNRTGSGVGSGSVTGTGLSGTTSTNPGEDSEDLRKYLNGKAKELEAELTTYRQENLTLKKLKKEQEVALSEKRAEVNKWAVEERQKTEIWCEDQRQAALRERNASLKLARDSRLLGTGATGTLGVRKERAEIEALQATIEKLRMDYEAKEKKWRANEKRLQQLIKDNSSVTEELQQQITNLEQNKQAIWTYLDSIGVRLPGSLIRAVNNPKKDLGSSYGIKTSTIGFGSTTTISARDCSSNSQKGGPKNMYYKNGSTGRTVVGTYAIEIDPEHLEASNSNLNSARQAVILRVSGSEAETQKGVLANAIFNNVRKNASRGGYDDNDDNDDNDIGQNSLKTSALLRPSNDHHEPRFASSTKFKVQNTVSKIALHNQSDKKTIGGKSVLGIDEDLKASWARSSRSSRYSSDDNNQLSEDDFDQDRSSVERNEYADTIKAGHSGIDNDNHDNRMRTNESNKYTDRETGNDREVDRERISSNSSLRATATDVRPTTTAAPVSLHVSDSNIGAKGNTSNRTEELLPDGRRLISYRNGTRKEMLPTGETLVRFINGDSKTTGAGSSGVVVYYYAQADTTHTTYKDGLEVYEFPNNQVDLSDLVLHSLIFSVKTFIHCSFFLRIPTSPLYRSKSIFLMAPKKFFFLIPPVN